MSDGEKDTPTRSARQWVVVRGTSMDLRVGAGILSEFPSILRSAAGRPHACALVHEAAAPEEAVRVLHDNLCDQGFRVSVLPLGEVGCNLSEVERLSAMLRDARITADDIVLAVGGLETLSVASFACSSWCGGTRLAEVPLDLESAVVAAFLGGLKVSEATSSFYEGVKSMAEIVFLLALATAIIIIAENGHILDTILHFMAGIISHLNSTIASWAAFIMQAIINFFIPSGSSKAVLTMPILAPLSDLIGISRQTMILAYQFGDGWTNVCIPTSAVVIGVIGMAKLSFQKWFRFVIPLVGVWFAMSFVFLAIANYIKWQ